MARRGGFTLGELVLVLAISALAVLILLLMIPGQRAGARGAACRSRLSRLGVAMVIYDQSQGKLPMVPSFEEGAEKSQSKAGPLYQVLEELGQFDFAGFTDPESPPAPRPGAPGAVKRITGLLCPDDPRSRDTAFQAPVSYRASTGDTVEGTGGAFAIGRKLRMAEIEAADGLAYTALFSERLLGTGEDAAGAVPENYAVVKELDAVVSAGGLAAADWRGDAGKSWAEASWSSTLYNHAARPGIANSQVTGDGAKALLGASSGHVEGVHVLKGDLSVSVVSRAVDEGVWKALGRIDDVRSEAGR